MRAVTTSDGLPDGKLYAKRNAICLKPKTSLREKEMPSVTREMKLGEENVEAVKAAHVPY